MLNNLLGTLGFGQRIVSDGKPQFVVMQLAENLFITTKDNAKLPAQLFLCKADLARPQTEKTEEVEQEIEPEE